MKNELAKTNHQVVPGFFSAESIEQLKTITNIFNNSVLVPDTYRGKENFGNCAIVLATAARLKADPLLCLQNIYVVYGQPAMSSKMQIALFNTCGKYSSIHYRETGEKGTDSQGVIAWAKELSTGDVLEGPEVTIGIAKAEGWYNKNGSKWKTMPGQMLRYRAASWFIRTTAPELTVGLQTEDEIIDVTPDPIEQAKTEIQARANQETFEATPEALPQAAPVVEPPVKQEVPKAEKAEAEVPKKEKPAEVAGPGF